MHLEVAHHLAHLFHHHHQKKQEWRKCQSSSNRPFPSGMRLQKCSQRKYLRQELSELYAHWSLLKFEQPSFRWCSPCQWLSPGAGSIHDQPLSSRSCRSQLCPLHSTRQHPQLSGSCQSTRHSPWCSCQGLRLTFHRCRRNIQHDLQGRSSRTWEHQTRTHQGSGQWKCNGIHLLDAQGSRGFRLRMCQLRTWLQARLSVVSSFLFSSCCCKMMYYLP